MCPRCARCTSGAPALRSRRSWRSTGELLPGDGTLAERYERWQSSSLVPRPGGRRRGASPRRVPRGALVQELGERLHVGRVEGLVALCGANEVVLEGPERRGGSAADAGLLIGVLDVVPDGLGRDAEIMGDRLV